MDLLIELIVWFLRSLFGDPEKPADMSRRKGGTRQRGPYNYGDEGRGPGGARPKTLEEILEEVRREASQKREAQRPQPSPPPQPAQPQRKTLVTLEEVKTEGRIEKRHLQSKLERPEPKRDDEPGSISRPLSEVAPPSEIVSTPPTQTVAPIMPHAASHQPAIAMDVLHHQNAEAATPNRRPRGVSSIIRIIQQAPPGKKAAAVREGVILMTVFGPPRARNPYVPGNRVLSRK